MYNLESLKRKISKDGLEATKELLTSKGFPAEIKESLSVFDARGRLDMKALRALV